MGIKVVDRAGADHYQWGGVSEGWRLLETPGLSVIEERVPPGAGEVEHYHAAAHQFFFVLSGVATLEIGPDRVSFVRGQGVHVPPGARHRFANDGDEDVVFLVVSSPTTRGDRTNVS